MSDVQQKKRFFRRWRLYPIAVLFALGAPALFFFWYSGLLGINLRVVSPGKCYRSGQMPALQLKKAIQENGIKCVINLRGALSANWHQEEVLVCNDASISLVDIHLKLGELPPPPLIEELAKHLETGPYPLLVHCYNGADRSSLASVLFLMLVQKQSLEMALDSQMTWRQGHLKVGGAAAMDHFFDLYRQTGNGQDIKTWITQSYPSVYDKESHVTAAKN